MAKSLLAAASRPAPRPCRRLSDILQAKHYHIQLHASPKKTRFVGEVHIEAALGGKSRALWLHARTLEIAWATVTQKGQTQRAQVRLHPKDECISLHVAEPLQKGPVGLTLRYAGKMAESMHGLYIATDGPETAVVSQCEASDARAIVPCLDEPAFKACFTWEIITDAGLQVVTNGRAIGSKACRQGNRHSFAKTAPMSTYLLALTIGEFAVGAKQMVGKTPCQIWTGRNKEAQAAFAMDVTAKVLPWYVKFFGQPYAYHKLDQLAVPGFDAGAMENSGAIFYRQSLLLMDAKHTSRAAQKRIAEVIAHEIAHQWFGNLVTMHWWDDLWLNEAFATWMAFTVCDALWPDWHIWHDYLEAKEAALQADALESTHPIYAKVDSPAEATELFDVITYEKGCGVLRMAERFIGAEAFGRGIRSYMQAFRFDNARGADLWQHVAAQSDVPLGAIMRDWIERPGFPLIDCKLVTKGGKEGLLLTQSRFLPQATGARSKPKKTDKPWKTPVVIAYARGAKEHKQRVLLKAAETFVPLQEAGALQYAYANDDATGFYRLRLDARLRGMLTRKQATQLGVAGRMALVTDQWALTRAGYDGIGATMDVLSALAGDSSLPVFRAVLGRLRTISRHVLQEADRPTFAKVVGTLVRPHLQRLAPTGNDWLGKRPVEAQQHLAASIDALGWLVEEPDVLAQAKRLQKTEQEKPGAIDANLAGTIVALAAKGATATQTDALMAEYQRRKKAGASPEWQGRYLGALCCVDTEAAVDRVLASCLSGAIPQEQLRSVLGSLLGHQRSGERTWDFLRKHWTALSPKVGAMGIARLVETTGALPYAKRKEIARFFKANPVAEAERALRKADEAMQQWEALRQREGKALRAWLEQNDS